MMHNYRLIIEYFGKNFSGWQIQPNVTTVQGTIESAIEKIIGGKINLIGSGRTDAGVHALGQVANFKIEKKLEFFKFKHSLNSMLPKDIAIKDISEVQENFHSRFDAKKRSYLYLFSKNKSPFYYNYTFNYSPVFDIPIEKLNVISKLLLGEKDFTSFSKKKTDTKNMICNILFAHWYKKGELLFFRIDANRFLHGMVRTIVGTVLEIAEKDLSENELIKIIEVQNRDEAGKSLPPQGLYLLKVEY